MNNKEYFQRIDNLLSKLDGEYKQIFEITLDLFDTCAGMLAEKEQRIDKANKIIDELLLIGTNEYEIEEQLECLKRVLGGKQ